MRINIYGVGRSGTKAVQLYIAFLLAKKFGDVQLNYEPYFYYSRRGPLSFRGIKHDLSTKFLLSDQDKLSSGHKKFLRDLVNHDLPIVTKYIRGNGRIKQINDETKPELSVVVVRSLFGVLSSVIRMDWDFYQHGSSKFKLTHNNFSRKVVNGAIQLGLVHDKHIDTFKNVNKLDRITTNAIYWYLMNKHALQFGAENSMFVNYEDISGLPGKIKSALQLDVDFGDDISSEKFQGKNIHSNYPLGNHKEVSLSTRYLSVINEGLFTMLEKPIGIHMVPFNRKSGEIVRINDTAVEEFNHQRITLSQVSIKKTDFLVELETEIFELLNQVINNNGPLQIGSKSS
jgi:hypothetical protein